MTLTRRSLFQWAAGLVGVLVCGKAEPKWETVLDETPMVTVNNRGQPIGARRIRSGVEMVCKADCKIEAGEDLYFPCSGLVTTRPQIDLDVIGVALSNSERRGREHFVRMVIL